MACDNKEVVRLLLEKGFVLCLFVIGTFVLCFFNISLTRVDPGVKDGNDRSLTEIAIEKDSMDVVDLLWEAVQKEVPEKVRLQQLASVIYKEDGEEAKKKFHALLKFLSPELVSLRNLFLLTAVQVTSTSVAGRHDCGNLLQHAVLRRRPEIVRLLMEHGFGWKISST